ncbi:MAG: DUF2752 domain-containing protein [Victivallaceae bacterium]|nr:DUF2752 domain-containing protein [Victivallaceae bacterium]
MNNKTRAGIKIAVFSVIILGGIAWLRAFPAGETGFYPVCLSHKWFGYYCPACGAGRALTRLAYGDFAAAFRLNPLLVSCLPLAGYWLLTWIAEVFGGKLPPPRIRLRAAVMLLAVVLLYGILRNIPYPPFNFLAPP